MRIAIVALVLIAAPSAALAQWVSPPPPPPAFTPPSPPKTSYDWRSGNVITTTPSAGGTSIYGTNPNTGSTWNTQVRPNGQASGINAQGQFWTYDPRTGAYVNPAAGVVCVGTGIARTCTKGN